MLTYFLPVYFKSTTEIIFYMEFYMFLKNLSYLKCIFIIYSHFGFFSQNKGL